MIDIFKKLLIILFNAFYVLVSLLIILFLGYLVCLVFIISCKSYPFQTIFFTLFCFITVVLHCSLLFLNMKIYKKILIFILILIFIKFLTLIPAVKFAVDNNICIDTGICKEGIYTKINGEMMEVNKKNCLKYNKEWYESINSCYVR